MFAHIHHHKTANIPPNIQTTSINKKFVPKEVRYTPTEKITVSIAIKTLRALSNIEARILQNETRIE